MRKRRRLVLTLGVSLIICFTFVYCATKVIFPTFVIKDLYGSLKNPIVYESDTMCLNNFPCGDRSQLDAKELMRAELLISSDFVDIPTFRLLEYKPEYKLHMFPGAQVYFVNNFLECYSHKLLWQPSPERPEDMYFNQAPIKVCVISSTGQLSLVEITKIKPNEYMLGGVTMTANYYFWKR
jgi:hypothetical protein